MTHRTRDPSTTHRTRWLALALVALTQLPILTLILRTFGVSWQFPALLPSNEFGLSSSVINSGRLWQAILTSGTLAVATGGIAAWVGVAIARGMLRAAPRVRRMTTLLMFFPVIAPPVALGVGLQVLLLRLGLGATWGGVLLAHVIPAVGYVVLYLLGALSQDDVTRDEAARTLGASRLQAWWHVTLPALRRRLVEAAILGALVSWGQLALTLLVGGGVVRTMPVEILAIIRSGDDHLAALAALLLTVPPLLALGVLRGGAERTQAVAA